MSTGPVHSSECESDRVVPRVQTTRTERSTPDAFFTGELDLPVADAEAFVAELAVLRAELEANLGADDFAHLQKMERWGRACTAIGLSTAWLAPNPLSAVALALGRNTRWVLMHHVAHRGYD